MKMTIDDARYCLENGCFCSASCKYFSLGDPNCEDNVRKIAIETMHKYQKIKDIVAKWHNESKMKFATSYHNMTKITEVIEEGNDD